MSSRISQKSSRGFTLIEVLLSVAIVAVMMLLIYQTTSQTIQGNKKMEKREQLYHAVRVSLEKMVNDLSQAFLLDGSVHKGQKQGSDQMQTSFKGEAESVAFASLAHLRLFEGARESESCEIGYKLEKDPDDSDYFILLRRETPILDSNPEEGGRWIPLAGRVKKLSLEYYDSKKREWQASWQSEQDQKLRLPRAVKIKIDFDHPVRKDETITFTTIALIGMYTNAIDF